MKKTVDLEGFASTLYTLAQIEDIAREWLGETRRRERQLLAQRQKRDALGRFAR